MTPPAASAAARAGAAPRLRGQRAPRRYSGPVGGAIAVPRPRVGNPRRAPAAAGPLLERALHALGRVPDHRLLDRLIRGRFWIGLIAFALIGIVAMQLSLLKLNTGIGRALTHASLLQRENAELRAQVSSLSDGDRVQAEAARLGMVMAPSGSIRFLTSRGSADTRQALPALASPPATSASSASGASAPAGSGITTTTGSPSGGATTRTGGSASGTPATTPATTGTAASGVGTAPTLHPAGAGVGTSSLPRSVTPATSGAPGAGTSAGAVATGTGG